MSVEVNRILSTLDKPMSLSERIEAIRFEATRLRIAIRNRTVMKETLRKRKARP
jgi:hypothetical protein